MIRKALGYINFGLGIIMVGRVPVGAFSTLSHDDKYRLIMGFTVLILGSIMISFKEED